MYLYDSYHDQLCTGDHAWQNVGPVPIGKSNVSKLIFRATAREVGGQHSPPGLILAECDSSSLEKSDLSKS